VAVLSEPFPDDAGIEEREQQEEETDQARQDDQRIGPVYACARIACPRSRGSAALAETVRARKVRRRGSVSTSAKEAEIPDSGP
jgi:hypothetical protein